MSRDYSGIRESRPNTFNGCGGNSLELSAKFGDRCLKAADRTFSQGLQCQQINSIMALMSMEDSVFVVHSPQGCAGCASMGHDLYRVGQAHRSVTSSRAARKSFARQSWRPTGATTRSSSLFIHFLRVGPHRP